MAISKLNAEQFANMAVNAAGVIFEYAGKDGKNTAMHFFGADYEATVKTQDEMFRVLRNVVTTFWEVKTKESRSANRTTVSARNSVQELRTGSSSAPPQALRSKFSTSTQAYGHESG